MGWKVRETRVMLSQEMSSGGVDERPGTGGESWELRDKGLGFKGLKGLGVGEILDTPEVKGLVFLIRKRLGSGTKGQRPHGFLGALGQVSYAKKRSHLDIIPLA